VPGKSKSLQPAIQALGRALVRLRTPWMIIGGVAVQTRGVARTTRDVDASIRADALDLHTLVKALKAERIVPRVADFEALARDNFMLLLEHLPSATPIDLSLAWIDYEQAACERASLEPFGKVRLPVIRLEDLLVLKIVAWRDRDQNDVRSLLTSANEIDLDFVQKQVKAITDTMEEHDRLPQLRALLREIRPLRKR
jgi:hypothetical protein